MGRKQSPGLVKRGGIWHIDKRIRGRRICQSTGSAELAEAERYLARLSEEIRQAEIYGVRPTRTFEQAAAKFVLGNQHKRSLDSDIGRLKQLMPWIGDLPLHRLHRGALEPWIEHRRQEGVSTGTINHGLKVVRRIVNLAASEWIDEYGLTWLHAPPKIKLLPDTNKRQPYPLTWDEQARLFAGLPAHLAEMSLFAVNTGCRDSEICGLRWDWEVAVPALGTSVFIVPGQQVKNADDRLIVLNRIALSVIERQRGKHETHVFAYRGKPVARMLNSGWKRARCNAGLPQVRVHDLKHTFGRRLRAAGVSFEDRQDLLGHRAGRITTHYSAAELSRLIEAADSVCERGSRRPELVVLRRLSVS
ncbi:tyrosine-type recombinase/integrase [Halomonas sp. TRM85114]|uniref:tyrosine-type recombinase/integrase n=1 Tax=Halomonas jincaotanensis TaxID=2810616 RepID=UPI001BD313D2|nr:tyrosine-type recombinase/integrase [Halomonas jincaotanensis]MBS9405503.1 tyrosine-type recombinase/integrase [Halomonas jincaotanensis]